MRADLPNVIGRVLVGCLVFAVKLVAAAVLLALTAVALPISLVVATLVSGVRWLRLRVLRHA